MSNVRGVRVKTKNHHFRSKFEASIYGLAKAQKKELTYEPKSGIVTYILTKRYIPDFILPNGIVVEAKGRMEAEDRTKMITVKKQHPDLDIRFVFQNPRMRLSRNGKSYGTWATAAGFDWAEGSIPLSWWTDKAKDNING